MAANANIKDAFASTAIFDVTETAQGTLTFEKLATGLSIYDKVGWIINRIQYSLPADTYAKFNTSADSLTAGLTTSNSLTALSGSDPAVYDVFNLLRIDVGTAASGMFFEPNYVHDFTALPGGGILVLPEPLYLGVLDTGLASAARVIAKIWYTPKQLADSDYFNLIQARQLLISA